MRSALVIVTCLIAAACSATGLDPRPRASGFAGSAGVVDPYEDGKRNLAAGRYQVATERFAQALAADRSSVDALNGLAIAYARLGRFETAQTYFERALQIDPTSAATLNNYGWALVEQGRLREAKPFLDLAVRHAAEADQPAVAANLASMGQARPSALVAALEAGSPAATASGHRFVRLAANVHRLETGSGSDGPPEPATIAADARSSAVALAQDPAAVASAEEAQGRAAAAADTLAAADGNSPAAAADPLERSPAGDPNLAAPVDPQLEEAPIEGRPAPAAAIPPGDKR